MNDFSIIVKHMPFDKEFGGNKEHLKSYIIQHFQKIITEGKKKRDDERIAKMEAK